VNQSTDHYKTFCDLWHGDLLQPRKGKRFILYSKNIEYRKCYLNFPNDNINNNNNNNNNNNFNQWIVYFE
jgi:hypothetical protein